MIEIELHADVRLADLGDDVGGVLDAVEEIIRPVARIDRLDQQRDVLCGGEIGGAFEIVDEHALGRRALLGRNLAGQAMHRAAADRGDVVERAGEQRLEIPSRGRAPPPSRIRRRARPGGVLMPRMVSLFLAIAAFTAEAGTS